MARNDDSVIDGTTTSFMRSAARSIFGTSLELDRNCNVADPSSRLTATVGVGTLGDVVTGSSFEGDAATATARAEPVVISWLSVGNRVVLRMAAGVLALFAGPAMLYSAAGTGM
jgi:hypothetical protein